MPPEMVDWELAAATARRLAPPGPAMSLVEAEAVVRELRELAAVAEGHVADYTELRPAPGATTNVAVVDRPEWARSNAASLRLVVAPLFARLAERRTPGPVTSVARRLTGLELGGGLAWLSTKVLGQYEVFLPPEEGAGRLTLVAPNIVEVERRLSVEPRDFRLWVALHEQTHRSQFTAVPWMREYLETLISRFLEATDLDPTALFDRLRDALRGGVRPTQLGPLDLLQTPEQRRIAGQLQEVMTLLEGHAEHVMDAVGPAVVPSVETIRRRFDARRGHGGAVDRIVRRLLGLDAKLEQYRRGGRFVSAVVKQVGVAAFNQVWTGPDALPDADELAHPARWVARVSGAPGLT